MNIQSKSGKYWFTINDQEHGPYNTVEEATQAHDALHEEEKPHKGKKHQEKE